jgi:hypothetical protein
MTSGLQANSRSPWKGAEANPRTRSLPEFQDEARPQVPSAVASVLAWLGFLLGAALSGCYFGGSHQQAGPDRCTRFIACTDFTAFTKTAGSDPRQIVLVSSEIAAGLDWNELVVSWNAPPTTALRVEARALGAGWSSGYYNLGLWSLNPERHPRTSVKGQKDHYGSVHTDTLVLTRPANRVQLRLTLTSLAEQVEPSLKFLGLSFLDSSRPPSSRPPNRRAWGKTIPVPAKGQLDYAGGDDWCSPTSVSMVLAHWARVRGRSDWNVDVPEAARQIHDPAWGGTGNWCFNAALAGSLPGMRACVTRCRDLTEVEDWTRRGFPVVLSVSFNLLNGRRQGGGPGHLVVCVGFTDKGDVVINDPWAPPKEGRGVRRVYPRPDVLTAWQHSHNTVYLIYPERAYLVGE